MSDPLPRELGETILVGRVVRPHGLRGEVKVEVHSDVATRFDPGGELLLIRRDGTRSSVRIASRGPLRAGLRLRFEGCESRDQAEELRGGRLEVASCQVPPAPEGSYYYWELVGCRCFDAEHGELGEVTEIVADGGGTLLRVEHAGRDLLVPFVDAFLRQVDVVAGRIDLTVPPGLVELGDPGS